MAVSKKTIAGLSSRTRPGTIPSNANEPSKTNIEEMTVGLELSEIVYKPIDWFKPDPENEEFEQLKNKQSGYWDNLQRDIQESGVITPLLAMTDGLIVHGHSRYKISSSIKEERFSRLPVQIILSPLDVKDIRKRRRLDNLLRFEIDEIFRLKMYADIWPDFYKYDPEDPSFVGYLPRVADVAAAQRVTERSVQRDRKTMRIAIKLAAGEGFQEASLEHITRAKEICNQTRQTNPVNKKRLNGSGLVLLELVKDIPQEGYSLIPGVIKAAEVLNAAGLITDAELKNIHEIVNNKK
jgi:hypothetical protein